MFFVRKVDCAKKAFVLFENCKTLFVFGRGKKGIFVKTICFCKISFLVSSERNPESNAQIWEFSRRRVNPKLPFFHKGVLEGVSERLFTICDPQKLCSAENTVVWCSQQSIAFASCKKHKLTKSSGLCFNMREGVF